MTLIEILFPFENSSDTLIQAGKNILVSAGFLASVKNISNIIPKKVNVSSPGRGESGPDILSTFYNSIKVGVKIAGGWGGIQAV